MVQRYCVELIGPDGQGHQMEVAEDESIWAAALKAGIELPHTCLQGWCLSCAAKVLEGDFDPSAALRYYKEDRAEGFILLCTANPRSRLRVVTHQKQAMREHRTRCGLPTPLG